MRYELRETKLQDTCNSFYCLDSILKADPKNVNALSRYGQLLQKEKKYLEAIKVFTTLVTVDSFYSPGFAFRDRANCKNNLNNDTGAINDMTIAVRLNPAERSFYVDRGTYYYNLNNYKLAMTDFNKTLEIVEDDSPALIMRARLFVELEEFENAIIDYKRIKDFTNFSAYDYYYRGIAKYNLNDKNGACEDWGTVSKVCIEAKDSLDKYCNDRQGSR